MSGGRVEAIWIRPAAAAPSAALERARLEAGRGIVGDRYHAGTGTFSWKPRPGRPLTLIAAEELERLEAEEGMVLTAEQAGRNVVTRGVDVAGLVGRRLRIGTAELFATDLCEPCDVLERTTGIPGLMRAFVHRAGVRARVDTDGEIAVGDAVVLLD